MNDVEQLTHDAREMRELADHLFYIGKDQRANRVLNRAREMENRANRLRCKSVEQQVRNGTYCPERKCDLN